MKAKLTNRMVWAGLALVALLSGCIVHDHSDPADITFLWDYGGYSCASEGVEHTVVNIWDGDYLESSTTVYCDATGVTLQDFVPGWYTYDLQGFSSNGVLLYESRASINLSPGSNVYNVSLSYVGPY